MYEQRIFNLDRIQKYLRYILEQIKKMHLLVLNSSSKQHIRFFSERFGLCAGFN